MNKPTYLFLTFFLICIMPCNASKHDLGPDLPDTQIHLFSGPGSKDVSTVNLNIVYKDVPLVGILYLPNDCEDKLEMMKTFYQNYLNRESEFTREELEADDCTCIVMTNFQDRDLRRAIANLKILKSFFLACDDNFLVERHKINLKHPALMLFDHGKLFYKESIVNGNPIPLF